MGNANSGERRKSREGDMSSDMHVHGTRRKTRPSPTYDDTMIEPVNITATGHHKGHAAVTATSSAGGPSRGAVPPHRPRATTESAGSAGTAAMVMHHHQYGGSEQAGRHRKVSAEYGRNGITSGSSGSSECSSSEAPTVAAEKTGGTYEKPTKRPTMFKYPGTAKEVYICGTFNNWQRLKMSRSTKDFVATVDLPEGAHEYKFVVDGQWANDPNSKDMVEREGSNNNVIRVRKEDFNAFDALDMDSEDVLKAAANSNGKTGEASNFKAEMARRLLQPGGDEFGQEMPTSSFHEFRSGPPILPPHLLQVILNKDTPLSCEPTLLPEPNHVMINHLYALSIKDGVMVLSSTQRYRKKYVTTLLYKPMGSRKED